MAYRNYLQSDSTTTSTHVSQIHQRAMQSQQTMSSSSSFTSAEAAEWQRMAISRRQHSAVQHFQTIQDYESVNGTFCWYQTYCACRSHPPPLLLLLDHNKSSQLCPTNGTHPCPSGGHGHVPSGVLRFPSALGQVV